MKLTKKQIEFLRKHAEIVVECLPEDISIKGNVLASGDDAEDKLAEDSIREDLENGNEWAWCTIKVSLQWKGYEGVDYLGACSYKSKSDFIEQDGYFPDMVASAFDDLVASIENDIESFKTLLEVA
jgi:hypothetical protein